jgi:hypothetical protein
MIILVYDEGYTPFIIFFSMLEVFFLPSKSGTKVGFESFGERGKQGYRSCKEPWDSFNAFC